jgi:hypothetical protein
VELKLVFTDCQPRPRSRPYVTSTLDRPLGGPQGPDRGLEARDLRATVSLLGVPVPVKDYPARCRSLASPKGWRRTSPRSSWIERGKARSPSRPPKNRGWSSVAMKAPCRGKMIDFAFYDGEIGTRRWA